jgi:DNA-binding NtrC family response regulator
LLLEYFVREHNRRLNTRLQGFDRASLGYLIHYPWPGNVRELKNVTEYACNLKSSGFAGLEDLPPYMSPLRGDGGSLPECIDMEKIMVEEALRLFGRSTAGKREAARYLGISVSTLYRRLNRQGEAGNAR